MESLVTNLLQIKQEAQGQAYLRQDPSYLCCDTDPWSRSPPEFNHLFIGPLPTLPESFMQIRLEVFANRETQRHFHVVLCGGIDESAS